MARLRDSAAPPTRNRTPRVPARLARWFWDDWVDLPADLGVTEPHYAMTGRTPSAGDRVRDSQLRSRRLYVDAVGAWGEDLHRRGIIHAPDLPPPGRPRLRNPTSPAQKRDPR